MIRKPEGGELGEMRPGPPPPAHHLASIVDGTTSFAPRAVLGGFGMAVLLEITLPFALVTIPLTLMGAAGWWILYRDERTDVAAAFQDRGT